MTADDINKLIQEHKIDTNQVSDGYHTFGELYEHRIQLWIKICQLYSGIVAPWRTQYHSDGELAFGGGWFVLGLYVSTGKQITYHLPMKYWDQCEFAATLSQAPEWDGHTSNDVLERIKLL